MQLDNKVPVAVEAHSHLNLPTDHISSGMFMLLQPMYYKHTLKTENNQFLFTSEIRPNPIAVPTFGRIRQNLRHFFVPYRLIFPNWEEFTSDVIASNYTNSSQVTGVPYMDFDVFYKLFTTSAFQLSTVVTTPTTSPRNYDFIATSGDYRKFTRLGRNFYKVLRSLGYAIVPASKGTGDEWNALALLAYAKAYCDWFTNSQYLNDAGSLNLK